jgi:hypothetical protein
MKSLAGWGRGFSDGKRGACGGMRRNSPSTYSEQPGTYRLVPISSSSSLAMLTAKRPVWSRVSAARRQLGVRQAMRTTGARHGTTCTVPGIFGNCPPLARPARPCGGRLDAVLYTVLLHRNDHPYSHHRNGDTGG